MTNSNLYILTTSSNNTLTGIWKMSVCKESLLSEMLSAATKFAANVSEGAISFGKDSITVEYVGETGERKSMIFNVIERANSAFVPA